MGRIFKSNVKFQLGVAASAIITIIRGIYIVRNAIVSINIEILNFETH